MSKELTWEEIIEKPVGEILHDEFNEGVRFIIMRGPSSLCAYVGVPTSHPLANKSYDNLPIDCHGGLTYSGEGGSGKYRPEGFFWYGWDYGHCDDYAFYYDDQRHSLPELIKNGKKWLVKDVIEDSWSAIYDFKKLIKLTEEIISFPKKG